MAKINEVLKKHNLPVKKIEKIKKVTIIDTGTVKYVYKDGKIDEKILEYLKSRNFDYMPQLIENGEYQITKYIECLDIPNEQKIIDLIKLTALLHSKTTHYKEIDLDDYEGIYSDIDNNLNYSYTYYTDLITIIESKIYPSPSEQFLARNISKIYDVITENKKRLENWHTLIKNKTRQRNTIIHGNLHLDHFIRNENSYLISWNKAKIASPIFDLYKLYINHALDFDFKPILKVYESIYPLTEDEKKLLYILISMVEPIKRQENEYETCKYISHVIDRIYKTEKLISPEAPKEGKKQ